jgi:16S rRNA processing protein RimM
VEAYSEHLPSLQAGGKVFFGEGKHEYRVRDIRPHRKQYLLFLEGIQTRDQADPFRGLDISVPLKVLSPLPEGVYYHWQIIGLEVIEEGGEKLGSVSQIIETGANDVYVVRMEGAADLLLPAIESVVLEVDLDQGVLRVRLLPGLR